MRRADILHILSFMEEIEALIDADEGAYFDLNVIDKFNSSKQILTEELHETKYRE